MNTKLVKVESYNLDYIYAEDRWSPPEFVIHAALPQMLGLLISVVMSQGEDRVLYQHVATPVAMDDSGKPAVGRTLKAPIPVGWGGFDEWLKDRIDEAQHHASSYLRRHR